MAIKAGFIVPHPPIIVEQVGGGEEKKIQKSIDSYNKVADKIASIKPHIVVLVSPHGNYYSDYFHIFSKDRFKADLSSFRAPTVSVDVKINKSLSKQVGLEAENLSIPAGGMGHRDLSFDHGAVIPLYFINQKYRDYELVHISLSGLSRDIHYGMGLAIQKACEKKNQDVVFIASGDLSHRLKQNGPYGYVKEGVEFDKEIVKIIESANFSKLFEISPHLIEMASECGLNSLVMLAGCMDKKDVESRLLSYEDTFGVGYAVGSFHPKGDNPQRCYVNNYKNI